MPHVDEVFLGVADNVAIHCANTVGAAADVCRMWVQLSVQMSQILITWLEATVYLAFNGDQGLHPGVEVCEHL